MKLLLICPMLPWPVKAGGDLAVFNMVKVLQNLLDIHYLYPTDSGVVDSELKKEWNKVHLYPYVKKRNLKFIISRLCIKRNNHYLMKGKGFEWLQSSSVFFTPDFLDFITESISTIHPDIIQTEFYNYQDLVFSFPEGIKKVFIQHEIHYIVNAQRLKEIKDMDVYKKYIYNRLASEEIMAMNHYDAVFTLTEEDRNELLRDGITSPVYTSPIGVFAPQKRNDCHFANKLIFVGGSGHSPNIEGLNWFLENVWENILLKHPNILLNIIGKWEKGQIAKYQSRFRNIVFKGYVSNLGIEYDGAIAIVPILRGSGMRVKILDAVNYGSPFVSTSIGIGGLEYRDEEDCFVADTPQLFAERVLTLIEQESWRQKFYDNSLVTNNQNYAIEGLARKRFSLYKEVLGLI